MNDLQYSKVSDFLWESIRDEVQEQTDREPILASFLHATILNHVTLEAALSFHLANKLDSPTLPAMLVREIIQQALDSDERIVTAIRADIRAFKERDPAALRYSTAFLYFKGFHALQTHRVAHWLWNQGRSELALFFQSLSCTAFSVDIHPAARIGQGILLDHATGLVVGETAVIEDNVSILHSVTLGGTGKETGDRHPKIRSGVLISVGAKILGNVEVGRGAKVGASSVVLTDVPPHTTVVGVPAKVIGKPHVNEPSRDMCHSVDTDVD